eukprot:9639639-Ditylum_brightwellii.AAC.1
MAGESDIERTERSGLRIQFITLNVAVVEALSKFGAVVLKMGKCWHNVLKSWLGMCSYGADDK